jgi:hypothetical protein
VSRVLYCTSALFFFPFLRHTYVMSLLHKNGILKEYRRQHREELAAQKTAGAAAAEVGNDTTANRIAGDDEGEFPDVTAFQVVGTNTNTLPLYVPPSSQTSAMSTIGEGNTVTNFTNSTSFSSQPCPAERDGKSSQTNGKPWPSSLTIQTTLHNGSGAVACSSEIDDKDERSRIKSAGLSSQGGSQVRNGAKAADGEGRSTGGNEADEFECACDYGVSPLTVPNHERRDGGVAAVLPSPASQSALAQHSRSDVTDEGDRVARETHPHSLGTEVTVSPTTVTTGVEAFLNATDAPEGVNGTYGPSLHVSTGHSAAQRDPPQAANRNANPDTASGSLSCGISSTSGLPFSPTSSKPHTPTNLAAAQQQAKTGVQNLAQAAPGNSSGAEGGHRDQAAVDVSSSSSSATETADGLPGKKRGVGGDSSMISEEAVEKLKLNVTSNSVEGDTLVTGGSPGMLWADVSDTFMQPPTSILSEPSTLDTTTANLASLRNRSQARKAAGRAGAAAGKQQQHDRNASLAPRVPDSGSPAGGGEEDAFSRVSATEYPDGGAGLSTNLAPLLVDTRVALGPSHLLSFSGTARTLPRIGEDEDVDVDPSCTLTDLTGDSPLTLQPITFCDAFALILKDMNHEHAAVKDRQHTGADAAEKSATAAPSHPALREDKKGKKENSVLASIFGCCGFHESDVKTRQHPPAHSREAYDLDHFGSNFSAFTSAPAVREHLRTAGAPTTAPEDDLQVVKHLKTRPVSLQNITHRRMLYTVFNVLTGQLPWRHLREGMSSNGSPLRPTPPSSMRSVRWESIGFQGSNPATDVRATGVLGVLLLLYLIEYYPAFAKHVWDLCQNPSGAKHTGFDDEAGSSPPRTIGGIANELPFVLVCFNLTAIVLDAAGQHILDTEIEKTKRSHLAVVVPMTGVDKPEDHLAAFPGLFVCCEAFVGALELFVEAWCLRRRGEQGTTRSLPPRNRPSIAAFGEIRAALRTQIMKRNGAALLHDAVVKVRGEAFFGSA